MLAILGLGHERPPMVYQKINQGLESDNAAIRPGKKATSMGQDV